MADRVEPETPLGPATKEMAEVARVFISYASHDKGVADAVCHALEKAGVACWIAPRDVVPGDSYARSIVNAIDGTKLIVLILSEHGAASQHVLREVERASSKRHPVIAFRIDAAPMPPDLEYFLNTSQWLDASGTGVERALPRLIEAAQRAIASRGNVGVAQGASASPSQQIPVSKPASRRTRLLILALGVLVALGLGFLAVDKLWLAKRGATQQPTVAAASVVSDKSIAVLPFTDMSEKHDQEYFGDGMAEEILDLLAQIPGLRVISRTSSFQFRGKSLDVRGIGLQLQVAYLLEGSVRRSNDQVRVTAQLLSTEDGAHRWSNTYTARIDDVLQVQDAIAAGISRALELAISGAIQDRAAMSPAAYDLFMRGLHSLDTSSEEGCEQAIGLFTQVLRLQPNSERALVSLARAHECISYGDWNVPGAGFEQAREIASRALKVNPHSADAHLVLATVYLHHDFDWTAAQSEIEAAAKLADPDARALTIAARLSLALGQSDRAVELLNQAISRDPLDPLIYDILGDTYFRSGLFDKSEAMYRRCLQIEPHYIIEHYYLSNAIMMQGRLQEALSESDRGAQGDGGYEAGRALIFHAMGRSPEADAALKRLIETSNDWPYEIARVYAFRGDRDSAFAWLDRAYQQHNIDLYYIKGDPLFRNLYGDPRYKAFLHTMNLPE
jgi:TolB-like protein/Flp pilus assembly protein TadD